MEHVLECQRVSRVPRMVQARMDHGPEGDKDQGIPVEVFR